MHKDHGTPPKYQQDKVEGVILDIVVEVRRISVAAVIGQIVGDPDDQRAMKTARSAIAGLREYGLLQPEMGDEILAPTPAAVKSAALRI